MEALTPFDLVCIDEVSQLSREDFKRIIQLCEAADKLPALVSAGDWWQLPGINPTKASDRSEWKQVYQIDLHDL
eukprot:3367788-Amphidinium_carterae.1